MDKNYEKKLYYIYLESYIRTAIGQTENYASLDSSEINFEILQIKIAVAYGAACAIKGMLPWSIEEVINQIETRLPKPECELKIISIAGKDND